MKKTNELSVMDIKKKLKMCAYMQQYWKTGEYTRISSNIRIRDDMFY